MRIAGMLWVLCVLGSSARASAQDEPVAPRIDVFAGGHYALGFGDICQRDADVVGCTTGESFVGAHALVLLRLIDHVSFGPSLAYAVRPGDGSTPAGSYDYDLALWRIAAEGRYWTSSRRRTGLYLAAEAGLALTQENLDGRSSLDPSAPDEESASQAAPLLGAGIGLGIRLPFGLALVPSVRLLATFFGDEPPELTDEIDAQSYGTLTFITLSLDASFGFGI